MARRVSELGPCSISACLVVRNEEAVIDRCLQSLEGVVDEIVLVHSGPCEDRTLEISARHGCRIFDGELGHAERNTPLAYEQARGEWLLNLDADEFLSPELARALQGLTRAPDVNGYAFLWRAWNGSRYVTEGGPYKLVLFRRDKTSMVGLVHLPERVEGRVEEVPLQLEHRPLHGPFALRTFAGKWRRTARMQAREYTSDIGSVPTFNCPGGLRWSRRRLVVNRLSPILIIPAGLHSFFHVLRAERHHLRLLENLRYAAMMGLYRSLVTAYVARFVYLRR